MPTSRGKKDDTMTEQNKRQAQRFDTLNLLVYTVVNEWGDRLATGMGRTLNISEKGILLEVKESLLAGQTVAVAIGQSISVDIGIQEDLVTLTGKVMHCKPAGDGIYHAGIQFDPMTPNTTELLKEHIRVWQAQQG